MQLDLDTCNYFWLVGLMEGEGCFSKPFPSEPNRPIVGIVTTDLDVAERAANLIGVSVLKRPSKTPEHHKDAYYVRAAGGRAIALMRSVRPHMSARRQKQIDDSLKASKLNDIRLQDNPDRLPVLRGMNA